jgi:hypothetical protein
MRYSQSLVHIEHDLHFSGGVRSGIFFALSCIRRAYEYENKIVVGSIVEARFASNIIYIIETAAFLRNQEPSTCTIARLVQCRTSCPII